MEIGKITAVCISSRQEPWYLPSIPFFCYAHYYKPVSKGKDRDRVEYLAKRRYDAAIQALKIFPQTEYFLAVDSYYVRQPTAIRRIVEEFQEKNEEIILGASTWRIHDQTVPRRAVFWDTWTTPEASRAPFSKTGWMKVKAVGGLIICPRWVFEKVGFGVLEPFPESGTEMNYCCVKSGLPVWLTFNVKVWHPPPFEPTPLWKAMIKTARVRLNLGRSFRIAKQIRDGIQSSKISGNN